MILFSSETNEVAILNFLRHSVMKGGKPVEDCIRKEMTLVKNKNLIDAVFSRLHGRDDLNETVKKIVNEYIKENDIQNNNDNDNDNENENERTGDDSSTNRETSFSYETIKEEVLNDKEQGDKICEWCGCKTTLLHKHHYPIPKRMGGKETVNICSNCHNEFHSKEREKLGGSFIETPKRSDPPEPSSPKKTKDEEEVERILALVVCLLERHKYNLLDDGVLELQDTIISFIEYRKKIKKPMTDHAINLLIGNLKKMEFDVYKQIEILNQSIVNGWQGIFPLKNATNPVKQQGFHKPSKAEELNEFYNMAAEFGNS